MDYCDYFITHQIGLITLKKQGNRIFTTKTFILSRIPYISLIVDANEIISKFLNCVCAISRLDLVVVLSDNYGLLGFYAACTNGALIELNSDFKMANLPHINRTIVSSGDNVLDSSQSNSRGERTRRIIEGLYQRCCFWARDLEELTTRINDI